MLTGDGAHLLVTNAGSGDVSVFRRRRRPGARPERPRPGRRRRASPSTTASSTSSTPATPAWPASASTAACSSSAGLGARRSPPSPIRRRSASRPTALAPRHRARHGRDRPLPGDADGLLGARRGARPSGPTPYGFAVRGGRHARRDRGLRRPGGQGRRLVVPVGGASSSRVSRSVGNGRSEICWAVITRRRPVRVHHQLRRRRRLALRHRRRRRLSSRTRPRASPSTGQPACATRTSPPTAASCTPSTPTPGASSAGPSRTPARSRRSAPGTACRRPSPGWPRAEACDVPRTAVPRDVHHARELERRPRRRGRN